MHDLALAMNEVHFSIIFKVFQFYEVLLMVCEPSLLLTVRYTAVSLANILTCEVILSIRSFMFTRKRIGPRTNPWGTPDVTRISDDFPLQGPLKCCVRPSRSALIQPRPISLLAHPLPW